MEKVKWIIYNYYRDWIHTIIDYIKDKALIDIDREFWTDKDRKVCMNIFIVKELVDLTNDIVAKQLAELRTYVISKEDIFIHVISKDYTTNADVFNAHLKSVVSEYKDRYKFSVNLMLREKNSTNTLVPFEEIIITKF